MHLCGRIMVPSIALFSPENKATPGIIRLSYKIDFSIPDSLQNSGYPPIDLH